MRVHNIKMKSNTTWPWNSACAKNRVVGFVWSNDWISVNPWRFQCMEDGVHCRIDENGVIFSDTAWFNPNFLLIEMTFYIKQYRPEWHSGRCLTLRPMLQITLDLTSDLRWFTHSGEPAPNDVVPQFSKENCYFFCQLPAAEFNKCYVFVCFDSKWLLMFLTDS